MTAINILGYAYTVDLSDTLEDMNGNIGFCNFDRKILRVANDVDSDVRNSTLLHEIIEAINYHLEIGLCEAQIKQLEVGLHQVFNESGGALSSLLDNKD